jgi:hypothetical protein
VISLYHKGVKLWETSPDHGTVVPHGSHVPFLLGMPSVRARVIGVTETQYVLKQCYETQNYKGEWVDVVKYYQRDRYYIDAYWADTYGRGGTRDAPV